MGTSFGGFSGGFLKGYADSIERSNRLKVQLEQKRREDRLELLKLAMSSPNFDQDKLGPALQLADEIIAGKSTGKGGNKGGLSQFAGFFKAMSGVRKDKDAGQDEKLKAFLGGEGEKPRAVQTAEGQTQPTGDPQNPVSFTAPQYQARQGPFLSREEMNQQEFADAQRKGEVEARKKQQLAALQRRDDFAAIHETLSLRDSGKMTENEAQARLVFLGANPGASSGWKPGYFVSPDGKEVPVFGDSHKPGSYQGQAGEPAFLPAGWIFQDEPTRRAETKKPTGVEQTREDAINAYKEKHGIKGELSAMQIQKAIAEQKMAEESPDSKALRAVTTELAQGRLADTKKAREAGSPKAEEQVAQDLASGALTFSEFRTLTAYGRDVNKKINIYARAREINSNFNPSAFDISFRFAATPKIRQQIASLNNVKAGVPDLLKASDEAVRTGSTLLNKAVIPGGIAIGNKRYSNFATARTAFADELSGALGYGSATDMSREMGFNMTDANLSPESFRSALTEIIMPFVERKKKTLTDMMGPYANDPGAGTPPPPAASGGNRPPLSSFEKK